MSARRSTGVILIASGSIGMLIGFVLSVTMVGAICGVPLIIVSIIFTIWGYLMKAKDQELKDVSFNERMLQTQAVASGVNICPKCKTPNPNTNQGCSVCGLQFLPMNQQRLVSVVDPIEVSQRAKQVKNSMNSVFEDEDS